jgi:hypothetical protein
VVGLSACLRPQQFKRLLDKFYLAIPKQRQRGMIDSVMSHLCKNYLWLSYPIIVGFDSQS